MTRVLLATATLLKRTVVVVAAALLVASCAGARRAPARHTAPPVTLSVSCDDSLEAVYRPPTLGDATPANRGRVLRCSRGDELSPAAVATRAALRGYSGPPLISGATMLRVTYQTERLAGQAGASSALVYLPAAPRRRPTPWAVFAHGTVGLADRCAPSRNHGAGVDDIALAMVGQGFAVIATDYAGLGTGAVSGHQGWGVAEDQAHSVLDAARALSALVPRGSLAERGALVGHSQGGGAVLAAQSLASSYGAGVGIAGVVAIAPGWYDARIFGRLITSATASTRGLYELPGAFAAMWFFSHHAVYEGDASATVPFAPSVRAAVRAAMDRHCILTLGPALSRLAPTFGDLYDPALTASVRGCLGDGPCTEPGASWLARAAADLAQLDPRGAPVLLVQGLRDRLVTPSATRCTLDRLSRDGVAVRACAPPEMDHLDVLGRSATLVTAYLDARTAGTPEPVCSDALPACEDSRR